jgi:hypothetical protein
MSQAQFDLRQSTEAVPTPLALWAAISLIKKYAHMLDDYNSDHHSEVREIMVKANNIARAIKEEADAKKAAKRD